MNWFGDVRGRASAKGHVQRTQRQAPSSVTAAHQGQRERARDPPARADSPGAVSTPLGSEGCVVRSVLCSCARPAGVASVRKAVNPHLHRVGLITARHQQGRGRFRLAGERRYAHHHISYAHRTSLYPLNSRGADISDFVLPLEFEGYKRFRITFYPSNSRGIKDFELRFTRRIRGV